MRFIFMDKVEFELDAGNHPWLQAEFGDRTEISYDEYKSIVLKSGAGTEERSVATELLQAILERHHHIISGFIQHMRTTASSIADNVVRGGTGGVVAPFMGARIIASYERSLAWNGEESRKLQDLKTEKLDKKLAAGPLTWLYPPADGGEDAALVRTGSSVHAAWSTSECDYYDAGTACAP
jgi:hypothetical protein